MRELALALFIAAPAIQAGANVIDHASVALGQFAAAYWQTQPQFSRRPAVKAGNPPCLRSSVEAVVPKRPASITF